jgi:hypothetical protein
LARRALQLIDEVAGVPDAEFVRRGQAEAFSQQAHEGDLPLNSDGPESTNL